MSTPMQPPMPQLATKVEILCAYPDCGEKFIGDIPRPRIMNAPDVTTISFAHQRLEKCPKCGNRYMFQVMGFEPSGLMLFQYIMIPQQNIIQPGSSANLKQAIDIANLSKVTKQ